MSVTQSPRRRVARERLAGLSRLPHSKLLLRQEYMIAVGRLSGLSGAPELGALRQHRWSALLGRELVTDAVAEYIADPFVLRRGGRVYLFFEVLNLSTGRGEISVAHSDDLHRWHYDGVALREDVHLSYPYVFGHAGETYMVPESSERGAVSLYRASDFPRRWERVGDLLSGQAFVDTSLFYDGPGGESGPGGLWWMVTSVAGSAQPLAFRAHDLQGPWTAVKVETDAGDTLGLGRSAGRVVRLGGQWYRPAQRTGQVYGEDLWLMRIELGAHGYREVLADNVPQPLLGPSGNSSDPAGWNSLGMHHLDLSADGEGVLVAVDGKSLIVDTAPRRALLRLRNKLFRIGRS